MIQSVCRWQYIYIYIYIYICVCVCVCVCVLILDAYLLNAQHYKVQIKGKWSNPWKVVAPFPTPRCSIYWKGSFCPPSTTVGQPTDICINYDKTKIFWVCVHLYVNIWGKTGNIYDSKKMFSYEKKILLRRNLLIVWIFWQCSTFQFFNYRQGVWILKWNEKKRTF